MPPVAAHLGEVLWVSGDKAEAQRVWAEGLKLAPDSEILKETMERLKEIKGVSGFHIMAIEWEEKVPEIVEQAGLFPRPEITAA